MDREQAVRVLGELAADQWGLVTSGQARSVGVDQVTLLRMRESGLVDQVGHGVYQLVGATTPSHLDIRVAWLRLAPETPAWKRDRLDPDSGVISHRSACALYDLGDIPAPAVEITVPRRRTTRERGVKFHRADLQPNDVTVVDGLPVTTAERTIVDLLESHVDGGHIGGVIADADRRGLVDFDQLAERVAGLSHKYGQRDGSGSQLLRHLVSNAGTSLPRDDMNAAAVAGFLEGIHAVLQANAAKQTVVAVEVIEAFARSLDNQASQVGEEVQQLSLLSIASIAEALEAIRAASHAQLMPIAETMRNLASLQTAIPIEALDAIRRATHLQQPPTQAATARGPDQLVDSSSRVVPKRKRRRAKLEIANNSE